MTTGIIAFVIGIGAAFGVGMIENPPPAEADVMLPECESSVGGVCANELSAGEHSSLAFGPRMTFSVPEGWVNTVDQEGSYVLGFRGGADPGGWGGDTIGVHRSVRFPEGPCSVEPDPTVSGTAGALHSALLSDPAVDVLSDEPATLGGLDGWVMDLAISDHWDTVCPWSHEEPAAPVLTGSNGSQIYRHLSAGRPLRLYVLAWGGSNIVVEVRGDGAVIPLGDFSDLAAPVLETFRFDDPRWPTET
ncbi:hypothetical protein [Demequina salsinemoris]|uniref:hypothetical protein n=1 Tax=Demequina salsinemoris TaxID=577470 RepID=UPI0007820ACB|nr:hypothetical protein [Demequina salsinemoris]